MHCHKILLESLERILLDRFLEQENEDVIFSSLPEGTRNKISIFIYSKIVSEYDQEIPQSQTADNPMEPRGRATQPSRDTRKTNSAKQPALSSPSR